MFSLPDQTNSGNVEDAVLECFQKYIKFDKEPLKFLNNRNLTEYFIKLASFLTENDIDYTIPPIEDCDKTNVLVN